MPQLIVLCPSMDRSSMKNSNYEMQHWFVVLAEEASSNTTCIRFYFYICEG